MLRILYCMTSETGGNVPNHFLNLMGLWQNYLVYWIESKGGDASLKCGLESVEVVVMAKSRLFSFLTHI